MLNSRNTDTDKLKQAVTENINQAINSALNQTNQKCIVSTQELVFPHAQLAEMLNQRRPGWQTISVHNILESHGSGKSFIDAKNSPRGIIVTDYSADMNQEQSEDVESNIRKEWYEHKFSIIVLSHTLPIINALFDSTRPWWNGPFDLPKTPYSLKLFGETATLVRYEKEGDRMFDEPLRWKIKDQQEF